MNLHTRVLEERYRCLGMIYGILTAVCFLGTFLAVWRDGFSISAAFLLLLCLLLVVFRIVIYLFLERPASVLMKREGEFADSLEADYRYTAPYEWSESNQRVLDRYQKIADRKEIMELSIESSRYIALQRQINPHFLYNALDAIRSDLIIYGQDEIARAVESLSNYFSYSISGMGQLSTISEELNNVEDYFFIQKYRFEDRLHLDVVMELDEQALQSARLPRLTLQPLVENAISHGLEKKKEMGTVTIHIYQTERTVVICVMDDGKGMDSDALEKINSKLELSGQKPYAYERKARKRHGIALENVNSRIRLMFGEEYGVKVFSRVGIGTDVYVNIPLNPEGQTDESVGL